MIFTNFHFLIIAALYFSVALLNQCRHMTSTHKADPESEGQMQPGKFHVCGFYSLLRNPSEHLGQSLLLSFSLFLRSYLETEFCGSQWFVYPSGVTVYSIFLVLESDHTHTNLILTSQHSWPVELATNGSKRLLHICE